MIKVFVLDTNSIISAHLLPESVARKAYDKALSNGIVACSGSIFEEFSETFLRDKFDKYLSKEQRLKAIGAFKRTSINIDSFSRVTICRDPKDNKFLELAIDAKASCIITGDKDLLVLNPFQNIEIISPGDFLKQ